MKEMLLKLKEAGYDVYDVENPIITYPDGAKVIAIKSELDTDKLLMEAGLKVRGVTIQIIDKDWRPIDRWFDRLYISPNEAWEVVKFNGKDEFHGCISRNGYGVVPISFAKIHFGDYIIAETVDGRKGFYTYDGQVHPYERQAKEAAEAAKKKSA
ncbi:MAG: hypothetical protein WC606_01725 [Candidatus Absconditabacterales bacterium]|jgi:hypothetical protein